MKTLLGHYGAPVCDCVECIDIYTVFRMEYPHDIVVCEMNLTISCGQHLTLNWPFCADLPSVCEKCRICLLLW